MSKYHCNSFEMTHWMFWKWWWEEFRDRNLCFATFFRQKKLGKKHVQISFRFWDLFWFHFFFGSPRWVPVVLPVVLPRCASPLCLLSRGSLWNFASRKIGELCNSFEMTHSMCLNAIVENKNIFKSIRIYVCFYFFSISKSICFL